MRRARPDDEEAVLGFATRTWNGWDYMPQAWPRWLAADDGVMLVGLPGAPSDGSAALDADGAPLPADQPVAVVRVALTGPGEAWLEGIRVDPRVRGMDVATDLQIAELHWAAANGAAIVRYATSARNEASHRLGARGGFELLTTLHAHWWSATGEQDTDDRSPSGFLPAVQAAATARRAALLTQLGRARMVAPVGDVRRLWQQVSDDPSFLAAARLYETRPWAMEELSERKFMAHLERGEVLRKGAALAIMVRELPAAEDAALSFAVLTGDGAAALDLIETVRRLANEPIRFRVAGGAPLMAGHEESFRQAGYVFPEWALHILWRPLDAGHPPPKPDAARLVLADPPLTLHAPD